LSNSIGTLSSVDLEKLSDTLAISYLVIVFKLSLSLPHVLARFSLPNVYFCAMLCSFVHKSMTVSISVLKWHPQHPIHWRYIYVTQ
jgi:hypothetical protein